MKAYESNRTLFLFPFLGMTLVVVLYMFGLGVMLESWVYERNEQELHRVVEVTQKSMASVGATADEMDLIADSVGLATANMRISIIDQEGLILGDSYYDEHQYINFDHQLMNTEVKLAIEHGHAKAIRDSRYLNAKTFFYAERFSQNGVFGVVRVSMPMEELNQAIYRLRWLLVAASFGGLLLLALLMATYAKKLRCTIVSERKLLEERVEERTAEIDMLQRLASMLAACNSIDEVQKIVADIVPKIIGEVPCAISLSNEKGGLIEQKIEWGGKWPGLTVFSANECWALRKGRYHISKDEHSSLSCQHMGKVDDKTLCVPLLAHGHAIGLLHVLLGDDNEQLHFNIVFTIAEHLGLALANLNMQAKLREQAIKDPLTRMYNRRFMDETLEKELNRSERHDKPFTMLLLDIDHFKPFNDNFGHDAGDFVLRRLGELLTDCVRKEDVACRVGGEEFAILLPETNVEDSKFCANKINQAVRQEELFFNGQSLGKLTVSIGIASFKIHGKDPISLYKAADVALYDAKRSGRDQAKVANIATASKVLDINFSKKNK